MSVLCTLSYTYSPKGKIKAHTCKSKYNPILFRNKSEASWVK